MSDPSPLSSAARLLGAKGGRAGRGKAKVRRTSFSSTYQPPVKRIGCKVQVCYCHDDGSWTPGTYLNGCSSCGCHRVPK